MKKKYCIAIIYGLIILVGLNAQSNKKDVQKAIDKRAKKYETIAKSIWSWAEVGYQEEKSSGLLKKHYRMKDSILKLALQKFLLLL